MRHGRRTTVAQHLLLAAVTYLPLLRTAPGQVAADTKQYLYLDPGRLLSRAWSMWDPNVGMGTVTHQNIGYLFPMGPWYWLAERAGLPDWVAQRLWLATLLFAAGAGVLFLARTLGMRPVGATVAALAYALSPYVLDYAGRISAILLPFAGLGWMLGLTVRALRSGSWRHPALFALVALAVGSVNATAFLYAGLAPALWVPYAVVSGEVPWRRAVATAARIGALTAAVSLWWAAGLAVQGRYGLPVLRFTETVDTVAQTSLASETLRGLGYWFFYGRDKIGPWIDAAVPYTQDVRLILVSFAVPVAALVGAAFARFRHRGYFAGLVFVGTVIAVGAHPYDHPAPLGALFKAAATGSTAGLAMRSTGRAVPLVVVGLAVLLGAGVATLAETRPRRALAAAVAAAALVAGAIPPLWQGTVVDRNLRRPERIPGWWPAAAAWLDAHDDGTRVLELPGSDFAAYRWGNAVDPVTPGLMDRPWVARELIPFGSPPSADLLRALDRRLQEGILEPEALAPIARLMGAGDIVLRSDLQYERYNTPRPRPTWALFRSAPGLGEPVAFGHPQPSVPVRFPMVDELALAVPPGAPDPPPVAVFPVPGTRPLLHTAPAARPTVVAGDGEGLVDLAAAGLLPGPGAAPVLYSASFAGDPDGLRRVIAAGADLVVTDTNRRRAQRWSTVREVNGYTERAGERPLAPDSRDARLKVFPHAGDDARTVVEQHGVAWVAATDYGNRISYTPEDRAANAFDGDPATAWRTGAFGSPVGQRLVVQLAEPVTTDRVRLLQPVTGPRNRWVTRVTLRFDGRDPLTVDLTDRSRSEPGQLVRFARRSFRRLEIRIDADNIGRRASYIGFSAVGFAEVDVAGRRVSEVVRMPVDLLDAAGPAARDHRLALVMTRMRTHPGPLRTDEEPTLARAFRLPAARRFTFSGTARLNAAVPDDALDRILTGGAPVIARSSSRLPGSVASRASSAFDGDPATAWQSAFAYPTGQWIEVGGPRPVTVDRLELRVLADGRHSVPAAVRIEGYAGDTAPTPSASRTVALPPIREEAREGASATVTVRFAPLTARRFRLVFERVRERTTLDYFAESPIALPLGVAEADLGPDLRVARPDPTAPLPGGCRTGLVRVDGRDLPVRVVGSVGAAESLAALRLEACDGAVALGPGRHELRSAAGSRTGIDVDRVVLDSPPTAGVAAAAGAARPPAARVLSRGRTSAHLRVTHDGEPFWVVLGQSHNAGWRARAGGHDLGPPTVVDGYANGWLVDPGGRPGTLDVRLTWAPQRAVNAALAVSGLAALVCCAVAIFGGRRRPRPDRRRPPAAGAGAPDTRPEPRLGAVGSPDGSEPLAGAGGPAAGGQAGARRWHRPVAVAVAMALAAGPAVGALAGLATWVAARGRAARRAVVLAAAAALAAAGAYTAWAQARYRYPPAFEWPTFFPKAHVLGWVAVGLLVAGVAAEAGRVRQVPDRPRPLRRSRQERTSAAST